MSTCSSLLLFSPVFLVVFTCFPWCHGNENGLRSQSLEELLGFVRLPGRSYYGHLASSDVIDPNPQPQASLKKDLQ